MDEERFREGMMSASDYNRRMQGHRYDSPRHFYDNRFLDIDEPDFVMDAYKPPTTVMNDLGNRVIYMGDNDLFTTEGQDEAYKELVELAQLIRKYPDAVTGVAPGMEGTVDFIDASNPPSERLATMMTKKGLPTYTPDNSMKPLRKNDADRVVEEQPIMSDPAESARRAGFRGVESEPKQIGVKRFFRRPDGTGYVKTEMFDDGGRFGDPTGPAELSFPQEMFIRGMHMESAFDPKVVSPAGAQGIAQIMPNTVTEFRRLGIVGENEPFDPFDVNDARKGQEAYMNYLITRNEGTDQVRLAKAVAAYNYGQKNLNRYLAKQVKKGVDTMNTLDWVDELPGETKDYVNALMFAEFPKDKRDYEKQRHRYFETYPDVQDERQATPKEDVAPMETKEPPRQISPELQNALDILVRDQKKYEHGGRHDDDPPAYSKGKQLLDYLDSYGVPGGRGDANNRFEATLQDVADFYLGRQGTSLGTEPQKQYDRSVRDFVTVPSESELFPVILDETFVTDDHKEQRKYADRLREDQFDDKGGYRSSVSNIQYDPVTERYISEIERQDLKRNDDQEILDRLVNRALVYNYPSSNPSGRPNVEEFYHAVQRTSDRAQGKFGGFDGNSEDVSELVDMARHTVGGALMFDDTHPVDQLVSLYYANEPLGFGDKHFYEGTSKDHSEGSYSRFNKARYYFGKGNKMEADAALQSAVYEAKKMGILPEGPITEQDLPGVLERLQGYTASQPGRVEFNPEMLKDWKPDGRKIAKVGKDGEITMTKYGQKWMQDDENKLRFRERTMTQGEGRDARLDTEYTRILETLIYDAVNKRNIFNPSIGSLENIRKEYDRAKSQLDEDDWRRDNAEYPYNQPGSGKTPTELLLNIINTGGGEYPTYRVLSDRSEKYLESRSE